MENLRLSWCGRIATVGVEAYGVVTLDGFATELNVFATIKLDTQGYGKTACLHPRLPKACVSFRPSAFSRH